MVVDLDGEANDIFLVTQRECSPEELFFVLLFFQMQREKNRMHMLSSISLALTDPACAHPTSSSSRYSFLLP